MSVRFGFEINWHQDQASVPDPSLGNDLVGKLPYIISAPLEHGNLHAAVVIEVDVQRRLR
jgi:hypothetical protein